MEAPKNWAYNYAKNWYRNGRDDEGIMLPYTELEKKMKQEGHSEEHVKMVKNFISSWSTGRAY
jgi:hypothetical protein